MDFAQTQALAEAPMEEFDEDIDPESYYKDETKDKASGDDDESEEMDDVDSAIGGKIQPQGFRTAAIQRDREEKDDSEMDAESGIDDDEVQVLDPSPNPTQHKRKVDVEESEEDENQWPTSSPVPVQKKRKESPLFFSDDNETPLEPVPVPPSKPQPAATLQKSAKENLPKAGEGVIPIIAVKEKRELNFFNNL